MGLLGLSASMKMRSKGLGFAAWSFASESAAGPIWISTRWARPARAMFSWATAACFGSNSRGGGWASGGGAEMACGRECAGEPDGAEAAQGADFEDAGRTLQKGEHVEELALGGAYV